MDTNCPLSRARHNGRRAEQLLRAYRHAPADVPNPGPERLAVIVGAVLTGPDLPSPARGTGSPDEQERRRLDEHVQLFKARCDAEATDGRRGLARAIVGAVTGLLLAWTVTGAGDPTGLFGLAGLDPNEAWLGRFSDPIRGLLAFGVGGWMAAWVTGPIWTMLRRAGGAAPGALLRVAAAAVVFLALWPWVWEWHLLPAPVVAIWMAWTLGWLDDVARPGRTKHAVERDARLGLLELDGSEPVGPLPRHVLEDLWEVSCGSGAMYRLLSRSGDPKGRLHRFTEAVDPTTTTDGYPARTGDPKRSDDLFATLGVRDDATAAEASAAFESLDEPTQQQIDAHAVLTGPRRAAYDVERALEQLRRSDPTGDYRIPGLRRRAGRLLLARQLNAVVRELVPRWSEGAETSARSRVWPQVSDAPLEVYAASEHVTASEINEQLTALRKERRVRTSTGGQQDVGQATAHLP